MKWSTLMLAARLYAEQESYDRIYREYLAGEFGPAFWDAESPTIPQSNRVLLFANQWKSRVGRSKEDVERLHAALHGAKSVIGGLRDTQLESLDLTQEARDGMEQAFDLIVESLSKNNATAASKIRHMFNRSLFVMWDQTIRAGYGVNGTGSDYAHLFLPRVQREVRGAIETSNGSTACKPLAKLADEFNYCKFTAKMRQIWDAE